MEETKAKTLLKSSENKVEGVKVVSKDLGELELRAPIVVDASGRDCFAAHKEKWKVRDPELNKIALWTYYKNAKRDPGLDEGATTVAYLPDKGWFWYIPLSGDMVSVGIVAERDYLFNGSTRDHAEIFQREVQNNQWIKEHLTEGQQTGSTAPRVNIPIEINTVVDGLVLAGDALGFWIRCFHPAFF